MKKIGIDNIFIYAFGNIEGSLFLTSDNKLYMFGYLEFGIQKFIPIHIPIDGDINLLDHNFITIDNRLHRIVPKGSNYKIIDFETSKKKTRKYV